MNLTETCAPILLEYTPIHRFEGFLITLFACTGAWVLYLIARSLHRHWHEDE